MKAKKKLSKRIDYPDVVFRQMVKIDGIMSDERMSWGNIKRLERALSALEYHLTAKKQDAKITEVPDIEDADETDKLFKLLLKKYKELNFLADEIGLMGLYEKDAPTYGV